MREDSSDQVCQTSDQQQGRKTSKATKTTCVHYFPRPGTCDWVLRYPLPKAVLVGDIFVSIGGRGIALMLVSTNVFFYRQADGGRKNLFLSLAQTLESQASKIHDDLEMVYMTHGPESDAKTSWNDAQEALAQIDKDLEFLGVTG